MASITERKGRFLVRVRRDGESVTKTFSRKSDGLAWGRKVESDMESGRWAVAASRSPSLREAIRVYRVTVAPAMKGAALYRYRFDEFEALPFAHKPVNLVTSADLAAWRDEQGASFKPGTVVRKLAMLSGIFSWAMKERGWIAINPVAAVRKPRVNDSRNRTLSDEEVAYVMAAAITSKATWLAPALTVLMHSAMRRSELFGLKRGDVDFDRATARLDDTKNGIGRDVPLCPRSLAALKELCGESEARGDDVLLPFRAVGSLSTRFHRTVERARRMYEWDCTVSGAGPDVVFLANLRLHDLRHHAVTMWAKSGALSLPELLAVSGHRSVKMVIRYTHLNASTLAGKLAGLANA